MKWLLIFIGSIIGIIAVVYGIGSTIPTEHVASRSAQFNQPPQKIWETITDFEAAPSWRKDLTAVKSLPDRNGHPVWKEIGGYGEMSYEIAEFKPPQKLVTVIADEELPFGGSWTYEIRETESGGSRVTITEEGKIYNPIYRFMAKYIFGHHATMENYLQSLAAKFDEEIRFEEK